MMKIWFNKNGGGYAESEERPTPEWLSLDEIPESEQAQAEAAAKAALYPETVSQE